MAASTILAFILKVDGTEYALISHMTCKKCKYEYVYTREHSTAITDNSAGFVGSAWVRNSCGILLVT